MSERIDDQQFGPVYVPVVLRPLFKELAEQLPINNKTPEDLNNLTEEQREMLCQFMDTNSN